ncbi:MAG TPA: hypothetical protein VM934_06825 [Pyrinomonadaceae bacterium]|nr:hypothetical protein [Pyrinomonadaceae bacterium]
MKRFVGVAGPSEVAAAHDVSAPFDADGPVKLAKAAAKATSSVCYAGTPDIRHVPSRARRFVERERFF